MFKNALLLCLKRSASASSRPYAFTIRMPVSVSCNVDAMSPIRSWPLAASDRNRLPIRTVVTTASGMITTDNAASCQFW